MKTSSFNQLRSCYTLKNLVNKLFDYNIYRNNMNYLVVCNVTGSSAFLHNSFQLYKHFNFIRFRNYFNCCTNIKITSIKMMISKEKKMISRPTAHVKRKDNFLNLFLTKKTSSIYLFNFVFNFLIYFGKYSTTIFVKKKEIVLPKAFEGKGHLHLYFLLFLRKSSIWYYYSNLVSNQKTEKIKWKKLRLAKT